eukprot:GHVT01047403.1.p1 GENE.GHVT01047403.1~~GHVT01047403.1.p1  ORF type:complete len:392 (-),score=88.02 GHVT01047403.1:1510-2685(-)
MHFPSEPPCGLCSELLVHSKWPCAPSDLRRTLFRPCIDLHDGQVKQIVGSTFVDGPRLPPPLHTTPHPESSIAAPTERRADSSVVPRRRPAAEIGCPSLLSGGQGSAAGEAAVAPPLGPIENFVSGLPSSYYARLYREFDMRGGHVVLLGNGNETAAVEALAAWPGALQVGGKVTPANAALWLERGAAKIIVTSWLFPGGRFDLKKLQEVTAAAGGKHKVVVDLSCKRDHSAVRTPSASTVRTPFSPRSTAAASQPSSPAWVVYKDGWQTRTDMRVTGPALYLLSQYCDEFLVHGAEVEGRKKGVDLSLVQHLAKALLFVGLKRSIEQDHAGNAAAAEHQIEAEHQPTQGARRCDFNPSAVSDGSERQRCASLRSVRRHLLSVLEASFAPG